MSSPRSTRSPEAVDVIVVGGGPAGSMAAADLAASGVRVVQAHRQRRVGPTGELLRADARPRLGAAGLWDSLRGSALRPIGEVVSTWGDAGPLCASAIVDPHGSGLLVDRPVFDAALMAHARALGARLKHTGAQNVERVRNGWHVELDDGTRLRSTLLVDATGRSAWITRRHGIRRRIDDLVAVTRIVDSGDPSPRMSVEAEPNGWRYAVPTFDGRRLVEVVVSDRDLLGDVVGTRRPAAMARSSWNDDGLVPVGDALLSLDPLSGAGITFGLVSGTEAAASIRSALDGDETAIPRYRRGAELVWNRELERRAQTYGRERRWENHQFWLRRHGDAAVVAPVTA